MPKLLYISPNDTCRTASPAVTCKTVDTVRNCAFASHPKKKQILLLLLSSSALLVGCDKPEVHNVPLLGQVHRITPGGKSTEVSDADVRVYDKKTFDAVLLDVKSQAEEVKRNTLDVVLKERERLKEEMRFCQMDKEQTERAKESRCKELSRNLDAYADELRKDLYSFKKEIDAINTTIEQDQKALEEIAKKERDAGQMLSRELLVGSLLNALPKPVQTIRSDAHGKFQALVKNADDYVVVSNASCEEAGDIEFYQTSIPPKNGKVASALLLSVYNWNADTK